MPQQQSNQSPYGNPYAQGGNRYIPPTFNYATNPNNNRPNYQQMDWNTMQSHYLPTNTSQGQMGNAYQQQLRGMLGQFSQQYGDPNRRPVMPNFSSYNPGFGGPTSYYDQQRGRAGRDGYDSIGDMGTIYDSGQQRDPNDMSLAGPRRGYMEGGQGGYEQQQPGRYSNWSNGQMPGPDNFQTGFGPQGGGRGGYGGGYGGGRGGYGGQMGMMPQFNPYMMMQNSMRGMDFNQMFDPRFASLFGGDQFGSRTPNSQQPQQPGMGGAGPQPEMVTKPLQMGGGG